MVFMYNTKIMLKIISVLLSVFYSIFLFLKHSVTLQTPCIISLLHTIIILKLTTSDVNLLTSCCIIYLLLINSTGFGVQYLVISSGILDIILNMLTTHTRFLLFTLYTDVSFNQQMYVPNNLFCGRTLLLFLRTQATSNTRLQVPTHIVYKSF